MDQDGLLFHSDVGDHPQKIIDIGTGAGECADTDHSFVKYFIFANLVKIVGGWAIDGSFSTIL